MLKTYKPRDSYIKKIKPFVDKDLIKVLTGQRRVGKSYLFFQLMDYLKKEKKIPEKRILYINKELHEFDHIRNSKDLIAETENYFKNIKSKKYLFIDEVQDIKDFEKALRSFNAQGDYDIYCSGSNANLLSSELATYLRGRYISFDVYPLSYAEFLDFHALSEGREAFNEYLQYGGLPYLIHLENDKEVRVNYLESIYNSILLKDIVQRYDIRNIDFLERLVIYLADNVGAPFSAKSISDYLKKYEKMNLSPSVIANYLNHLDSSYCVYQVKRADITGKKIFKTNEKYFFNDLGIRHALVGYDQLKSISKILENLVYIHLRRLDYKVKVGQLASGKEIDFIAEKSGEKLYVQVCYILENEKTKEREFGSLLEIKDNYKKIVLSMDEVSLGNYQGIEHAHIKDFLLKESL